MWYDLYGDVKFALRSLRRAPGFAVAAILTLALAIGANTAIFSVLYGVLLRPLPYHQPETLVRVGPEHVFPPGVLMVMRERAQSYQDLVAWTPGGERTWSGHGEPERLNVSFVSPTLFSVLGASTCAGRGLLPEEEQPGRGKVAVISETLWRTRFGAASTIQSQTLILDNETYQIAGVMCGSFDFPSRETQVWLPLTLNPGDGPMLWRKSTMALLGRTKPGIPAERAQAELRTLLAQAKAGFPWEVSGNWGADATVVPLQEFIVDRVRTRLWVLFAAVVLVLLIASANVGNLLLSRANARQREIGTRAALGASRMRLIGQLLVESLVLSFIAMIAGIAIGWQAIGLLARILPPDTPRLHEVTLDGRVLLFTILTAVVAGLLFGLAPAIQLSRPDRHADSRTRTGSPSRTQRTISAGLVVAEIALTIVLVIGAGLVIKSLWNLVQVDPGFRREEIVSARVHQIRAGCRQPGQCVQFYDAVLQRFTQLPGVNGAALIYHPPFSEKSIRMSLHVEGHPVAQGGALPEAWQQTVSPDYFRVMGIPLIDGRPLQTSDREGTPDVVVVNATMAKRLWPGQQAVGRRLKPDWGDTWWTVVGVVGDVRHFSLTKAAEPQIYLPYGQNDTPPNMTIVMRASRDAASLTPDLRRIVTEIAPTVPIDNLRAIDDVVSASTAIQRTTMWLLVAFAGLALVLGMVGVSGVMSYSVTRRTQEFGIRMALGATPGEISALVLRHALTLVGIGVAFGIAGALLTTHLWRTLLYEVGPIDPSIYAVAVGSILMVGAAAGLLPAMRATRIEPVRALRVE